MKTTREPTDFVEHPRFGKRPRVTGLDVVNSPDGRVYCHWHSPPGARIPSTAIVADVTRQRPATVHVTHYYDVRRVCRRCRKPFLFFAEEQKHWYEELGFPLEADCLECPPCRKDAQHLRALQRRYEELVSKEARDVPDTLDLVDCGVTLVEAAVFTPKLVPKLRALLAPLLTESEPPFQDRAASLRARLNASAS